MVITLMLLSFPLLSLLRVLMRIHRIFVLLVTHIDGLMVAVIEISLIDEL